MLMTLMLEEGVLECRTKAESAGEGQQASTSARDAELETEEKKQHRERHTCGRDGFGSSWNELEWQKQNPNLCNTTIKSVSSGRDSETIPQTYTEVIL